MKSKSIERAVAWLRDVIRKHKSFCKAFCGTWIMTTNKPVRKKSRQAKQDQSTLPAGIGIKSKTTVRLIWSGVVIVATILGLIVSELTLDPRFSFDTSSQLDPNDPFSIPCEIKNDGLLAIYNVEFIYGVTRLVDLTNHGIVTDFKYLHHEPQIPKLDAGDKTTIEFQFSLPMHITPLSVDTADIVLTMDFTRSWVPFKKYSKQFHLMARVDRNHNIHWWQQPS